VDSLELKSSIVTFNLRRKNNGTIANYGKWLIKSIDGSVDRLNCRK